MAKAPAKPAAAEPATAPAAAPRPAPAGDSITRNAVVIIAVIATALAIIYPSFGVTLLVVLIAETIMESRRARRRSAVPVTQSGHD